MTYYRIIVSLSVTGIRQIAMEMASVIPVIIVQVSQMLISLVMI